MITGSAAEHSVITEATVGMQVDGQLCQCMIRESTVAMQVDGYANI